MSLSIDPKAMAFTVREACAAMRISHSHFYTLVNDKRLRLTKLGGKTVVARSEIDRVLSPVAAE